MSPIRVANLKLFEHDPDEIIIGEARRSMIGTVTIFLNAFIIIAVLDVLLYLLIANQAVLKENYAFLSSINVAAIGSMIILIMTILVFAGSAMAAYVYHHNYFVLTDQKLVLVRTFTIVRRQVSQLSIGDVQDISVSQPTLMSRMFGYGTIIVETSGEQKNIWLKYISKPFERTSAIVAAHEADVRLHGN